MGKKQKKLNISTKLFVKLTEYGIQHIFQVRSFFLSAMYFEPTPCSKVGFERKTSDTSHVLQDLTKSAEKQNETRQIQFLQVLFLNKRFKKAEYSQQNIVRFPNEKKVVNKPVWSSVANSRKTYEFKY